LDIHRLSIFSTNIEINRGGEKHTDKINKPKKLCRCLGLPVITRAGLGMTCEAKGPDHPSAQVEAQALILPRKIKLCHDCLDAPPCTGHEPASSGREYFGGW
jgi:hypothetical protein